MSTFTCINCSVKFETAEIQREHYKTDWHRYNLKRRVAQLPPLTAEDFQTRVMGIRLAELELNMERQTVLYCKPCSKYFCSQKAHDNHFNSKKHKEAVLHYQRVSADEVVEQNLTTKTVISPKPHPGIAAALAGKSKYALKKNSLLEVPDCDDEDDDDYEDIEDDGNDDDAEVVEEGEEKANTSDEWEKIAENPLTERDCLFCKHTSEDIVENLKHMSVAHSFFIPDTEYCTDLEGLLYYLGEKVANYFVCLLCNERGRTFYSLDAVRKHMIDKGHCQMLHEGMALAEYADYYDYSGSYPDHQEGIDIDEEVVPELLDGDEYQLVLPSGAVIGHRSLLRYYKQRLNPERALVPKKSDRKLHKLLSEYRALGWTKTQQVAAARKARDIHLMKRVESKWRMKLGCRANKLIQHARAQVMF